MNTRDPRRIRSSKEVWVFRAINVVAGATVVTLVIMWQTGMTSKGWWEWFTTPKPTPVAKTAPVHPPTKAIGIARPLPKGNDSSVSPDPLRLVLVRVHPGRSLTEGAADIGVFRDSPQTYQAGALLESGARLVEIHTDYVLLRKEGRSARLYLGNSSVGGKSGDSGLLIVGGSKETPSPAKVTSREVLTDYIRPSPIYDGENLVGYQVYPGANRTPFDQMRLQPGDVIIELNGVPLLEPATAWDILRQLTDGTSVSALVKRHDATEQMTLDGAWIVAAEEAKRQPTQAMLAPGSP
jgi:hypothetical protein